MAGLIEMFHNVNTKDDWTFGDTAEEFDVPPNPGNDKADRYRAAFWNRLKRESHFYRDTAKLYGMIPFQRRGLANKKWAEEKAGHPIPEWSFHFLLSMKDIDLWQTRRSIELAFYFHPNAQVIVHSEDSIDTLMDRYGRLQIFVDSGYDLKAAAFDPEALEKSSGVSFMQDRASNNSSIGGAVDVSRATAYLLLRDYHGRSGTTSRGIFVSKSTFIWKEIPFDTKDGVMLREGTDKVAMMVYTATSSSSTANSNGEASLAAGMTSLDAIIQETPTASSWRVIALSGNQTNSCLTDPRWKIPGKRGQNDLGFVLGHSLFESIKDVTMRTVCHSFIEARCIFCDEVHTKYV